MFNMDPPNKADERTHLKRYQVGALFEIQAESLEDAKHQFFYEPKQVHLLGIKIRENK